MIERTSVPRAGAVANSRGSRLRKSERTFASSGRVRAGRRSRSRVMSLACMPWSLPPSAEGYAGARQGLCRCERARSHRRGTDAVGHGAKDACAALHGGASAELGELLGLSQQPFGAPNPPFAAVSARTLGWAPHPIHQKVPHTGHGGPARLLSPVQLVPKQEHGVRVVVAHEHELLAEALGRLLDDLGMVVVGSTCDAAALLDHLPGAEVDVLVLDAGFDPIVGPLIALDRIRAVAPGLRIVVLAEALDEVLCVAAREGDLDGVVLTGAAGVELVAAIAQVVAGHAVFPADWLRQVQQAAASNPLVL